MAVGASIDLSRLPAPAVVEALDVESYVAAMKADVTDRLPDLAAALNLESEPVTKLIEVFAYRELILRNRINAAAKATMLAFAVGPDLDAACANLLVQREAGESDDALRARTLLGPDSWSVAGPTKAYRFFALSADASITDVGITSPAAGEVRIAVLTNAADGVASATVLGKVAAALSADDVRPLTDHVTVLSGSVQVFNVTAELVIGSGPDSATVVAAANAAVHAYAADARRLGRRVSRNALVGALMVPGVIDCTITSPGADVVPGDDVAPQLGALTLTVAS